MAREGTQSIPLVGAISQRMQCLYVQREDRSAGAPGVSDLVQARMQAFHAAAAAAATPGAAGRGGGKGGGGAALSPQQAAAPLCLFPEGTTTNNSCLLPFKTGAFRAGLPLQPVVIKYEGTKVYLHRPGPFVVFYLCV